MNEKVTCEDVLEMALRKDKDFIESLEMVDEGAPNYASSEMERENIRCKIDATKSLKIKDYYKIQFTDF